jgi:hypothetical protein
MKGETKMAKTISTQFDPQCLPTWARKYPEVIEMARKNLAYRCNVCSAKTDQMRRHLIRQAQREAV